MAIGGTLAALIGDDRRGDHRRSAASRRAPARDRRLDRRDPPPHRSRDAARGVGCEARVRVAVERVADGRGPRSCPSRRPVARAAPPARRRRGVSRRRRAVAFARRRASLVRGGARAGARERRVGVRDVVGAHASTGCPIAACSARRRPAPPRRATSSAKTADLLVRTLSEFGVEATVMGQISGPRVTRYELQLAPGTKVSKVAGPQGRPELRARDDGDPHPRADPGQAGRGRRGAEPLAEARHPRRHLRRPPCDGEPALRLARQGHLRQRDLDRPRAHAAPPHRRHDRLGQVGLHQHDPHLDAPALDAGRGADDPHRPEADRARLLRVDPASADARRLEPEGSGGRAHERRRRDGAPLRAALVRPRPQPARGEPRVPRARRGLRCRTSSSSSTSSPT